MDLARLADLPDDVLVEARRVSEKLTELEKRKEEESKTNKIAVRRKALLRVMSYPSLGIHSSYSFCVRLAPWFGSLRFRSASVALSDILSLSTHTRRYVFSF